MNLAAWATDLADLVLPAGCVVCGTWIPQRGPVGLVCMGCRSRLTRPPWPRCPRCHLPTGTGRPEAPDCRECSAWPEALSRARSAFILQPPADGLVHALKYQGWAELGEEMGRSMSDVISLAEAGGTPPIVVPMPTTPARVRRRGYNQASLLAQGFAEARGLTLVEALQRTRDGPTQVALQPSERKANVKGAFAVRTVHSARLNGAHVLLIDDVLTTGSTASAAASELASRGAAEVVLVTYARALPFRLGMER